MVLLSRKLKEEEPAITGQSSRKESKDWNESEAPGTQAQLEMRVYIP